MWRRVQAVEGRAALQEVRGGYALIRSATDNLGHPAGFDVVPDCNEGASSPAVGAMEPGHSDIAADFSLLCSLPAPGVEDMSARQPTHTVTVLEALEADAAGIVHALIDDGDIGFSVTASPDIPRLWRRWRRWLRRRRWRRSCGGCGLLPCLSSFLLPVLPHLLDQADGVHHAPKRRLGSLRANPRHPIRVHGAARGACTER